MKKLFFSIVFFLLAITIFAQDYEIISEIKYPHHIVAKTYDDETCSIQVQLNNKTSAIYVFFGVTDSSLSKFVKSINAEFYEDKTIDRRGLTYWMNSNVAKSIKIESDEDDLLYGFVYGLVSTTLEFELLEIEDDVYIYQINTTLSKYLD